MHGTAGLSLHGGPNMDTKYCPINPMAVPCYMCLPDLSSHTTVSL